MSYFGAKRLQRGEKCWRNPAHIKLKVKIIFVKNLCTLMLNNSINIIQDFWIYLPWISFYGVL